MSKSETVVRDYRSHPTPEYRFFLFDPEWDGMMFFKSEEARAEVAAEAIQEYKDVDNGWSEEVERICMGEVSFICTQTNVQERPPAEELDEEGNDGEGRYWPEDVEKFCEYEMLPLGETPLVKAQKRLQWALARRAKVADTILWFDGQEDTQLWTEFTDLDATIDRLIAEGK